VGKKNKSPSSEEKEMAPLYTDTVCNRDARIATWEGMYNLLEEENPRVMEVAATTGSNSSSEASIIELACSFLHRIVARPKILPYTDMVKWILEKIDIRNRHFKTQAMYQVRRASTSLCPPPTLQPLYTMCRALPNSAGASTLLCYDSKCAFALLLV